MPAAPRRGRARLAGWDPESWELGPGVFVGGDEPVGVLSLRARDFAVVRDATTEVFADNHASRSVSAKLGYEPGGISRDARGSEAFVSLRLRLSADRWAAQVHDDVTVAGLDAARSMFVG